jgi:hypothetical protein
MPSDWFKDDQSARQQFVGESALRQFTPDANESYDHRDSVPRRRQGEKDRLAPRRHGH